MAARQGTARARCVEIVVGDAARDGTARRRVVHQRGANLRGSERTEWHRRRRGRSVLAAGRRMGSDVLRVRARGSVSAAVRRHSPRVRRPAERRAEARASTSDAGVRASRRESHGAVVGVDRRVARASDRRRPVAQLRRRDLSSRTGDRRSRTSVERRADGSASRVDRGDHRASVDGGDPDAHGHGRHVDRQLHRRRAGRCVGTRRGIHADGDGR